MILSSRIPMSKLPGPKVRESLWSCSFLNVVVVNGSSSFCKSPFGLAKMSCRLLTLKEVRSGSPSCVAVNDSRRAQVTSTGRFRLSSLSSPHRVGPAERTLSALADKKVCFLFLWGQETLVQQHLRTVVLPPLIWISCSAFFWSLSLAKELLFVCAC